MREGDEERRDLDPADLDEVRRRIVDPVLAELFQPEELTGFRFSADQPLGAWSPYRGGDGGCWLHLSAGAEHFTHPVAKAGFWLENADWVAAELADKLAEWICEATFGWGQWRSLPEGWRPPPPLLGRTSISIHFTDDDGGLPLWAGGVPAPWVADRLSPALVGDLQAWQALGEQLAAEAEAGQPPPPEPGASFGVTVRYLSDTEWAAHEAAEHRAAAAASAERRAWIAALEPLRDELVERLRAELGPDYDVPTPPRVR